MSEIWSEVYIGLHVEYPLFFSDFNANFHFHDRILKNTGIKIHENTSSGGRVVYGDGQTDKTTLTVALCKIANAPKNYSNYAKNVWPRSTKFGCPGERGLYTAGCVTCWYRDLHKFPYTLSVKGVQYESYPTCFTLTWCTSLDSDWNVMAHAQKQDFVFRRNGRVHLNRRGIQFSRLLAAEVCAWAVVMLDTTCSEVVWRVLATHSIRQYPLYFPSRSSPCAITFQMDSTTKRACNDWALYK
jgi:hypothetical protein